MARPAVYECFAFWCRGDESEYLENSAREAESHHTRLAHWGVTLSGAKGLTARGFAALSLTRRRGDSRQWTNVR